MFGIVLGGWPGYPIAGFIGVLADLDRSVGKKGRSQLKRGAGGSLFVCAQVTAGRLLSLLVAARVRLQGEPLDGVNDVQLHQIEPFVVRLTLAAGCCAALPPA